MGGLAYRQIAHLFGKIMQAQISTNMKLQRDKHTRRAYDTFNTELYRKTLKPIWRKCVTAYIEELVKNIHVDTGMSLASIQPLAKFVGQKTALIASLRGLGPRIKPGHRHAYGRFANNTGKYKSRAFGERLGNQAVRNKRYVVGFGTRKRPIFRFKFEIAVLQYFLNESRFIIPTEKGGKTRMTSGWNTLGKAYLRFMVVWEQETSKSKKLKESFIGWLVTGKIAGLDVVD